MFHAGGHKGINTRGRSGALSRHYPNFLSQVDWKAPLRCGIVFCTISCILFVTGIVFTWLGVHDLFGESVPITGPILLAVGGLMLILAQRQFCLAHTRKKANKKALKSKELGVTAITAIPEQDEEQHFIEAEGDLQKTSMDVQHGGNTDEDNEKPPLTSGGLYDSHTQEVSCGNALNSGDYGWPPAPLQHPYYSMAMMVFKDPSLFCSPYISANRASYGSESAYATNTNAYEGSDKLGAAAVAATSPGVPSSPTYLLQSTDTAVLETSSVTLPQPVSPTHCSSPSEPSPRPQSSKLFPADYLSSYQCCAATTSSSNPGISSLPNPTAFMMLRTLELQETI